MPAGSPGIGEYNGVYRQRSEHRGWPVLINHNLKYCYRQETKHEWHLGSRHNPDTLEKNCRIVAKAGPLPSGTYAWTMQDSEPTTIQTTMLTQQAAADGATMARRQMEQLVAVSIEGHTLSSLSLIHI